MKFTKTYRFMKGVYECRYFGKDNTLKYYDNMLTDSNIASSVNMGELTAGVGNPVVIQLPDSAKFTITLTAQDIDLRSRQLQTGGTLGYNGKTDTCEVIAATGSSLTLSSTPVAPYGTDEVVCYINGGATPYTVDPDTKVVAGFTSTSGVDYAVTYYVAKAASEVLDIKALFAPEIGRMEVKMPVFAAPVGSSANTGTLCGYWHVYAPNFQFSGEAGVQTNQTTAATSSLTGQALAYNPDTNECGNGSATLIYMVYEPVDTTEGIVDLVVLNGGAVSVTAAAGAGHTATIPVKWLMDTGLLANPDVSELTFTSGATGTATVDAAGVVTGVAAGDTEVTIVSTDPAFTAYCNVEVT